jgi:hypothetical protein
VSGPNRVRSFSYLAAPVEFQNSVRIPVTEVSTSALLLSPGEALRDMVSDVFYSLNRPQPGGTWKHQQFGGGIAKPQIFRIEVAVKLATSAFVLAWLIVPRVGAASFSIQPAAIAVASGGTFSLDINAVDIVDLYAFQFDINFTSGLLSATGITEGDFLAGGGATFFIPGAIDNAAGTATFTANTLLGNIPGVNGSGKLATINFNALSPGISPITLSGLTLLNSSLTTINADAIDGSVTVEAVPEPAYHVLVAALLIAGSQLFRPFRPARKQQLK